MIGHLGARVSALLDGQLPPAEAEEAWAHVYSCHACRDLVEREGWVKTRLAGLSDGARSVSPDLKGSLLSLTPGERFLAEGSHGGSSLRRGVGMAVIGGGALGAAMVGVIALGVTPGSPPANDRRPPTSRVETPAVTDDAESSDDERSAPVRANNPAVSIDEFGGPARAVSAVVPAWVAELLP